MLQLPDDIIITVATCVKRQSSANTDLTSFMLVCKRWHQLGLQILYRNIALNNVALQPFAASFNASIYGTEVRSLTLRIDKDSGTHPKDLTLFSGPATAPAQNSAGFGSSGFGSSGFGSSGFGSSGFGSSGFPSANDPPSNEPTLPDRLAGIPPLISQYFKNLVCFSLRVEESAHRSIPRATIAAFLDALPKSCQHLELDTRGQDHRGEDEQVHICDTVRRILPQLHNSRIRLGAMCCAMLGTGEVSGILSENGEEKHHGASSFEPIALPKLKSLLVNCGLPRGLQMQRCGRRDHTTSAKQPSWPQGLAWPSVTEALMDLVKTYASDVDDTEIYTILGTGSDYSVQACQTEIRIDIVKKEAFAFPSLVLGRPFGAGMSYLLRKHDGSEVVMKELEDIEEIAEGHIWRDIVGGARLPAEALQAERSGHPSFATGCIEQPLPVQQFEEWRKNHVSEPLSIQILNENKAGKKLVFAERRAGKTFPDIRPIKEITPEGWRRTRDSILVPI